MDNQFKCTVCNKVVSVNFFEEEQRKCFFHCEKNSSNNWYTEDKLGRIIWNNEKVRLFWRHIQESLDNLYTTAQFDKDLIDWKYEYNNVVFPKFEKDVEYFSPASNEDELGTNFYSWDIFPQADGQNYPHLNTIFNDLLITFKNCTFLADANLEKYKFKKPLIFKKCTFQKKLKLSKHFKESLEFRECDFYGNDLKLTNTIFEGSFRMNDVHSLNVLSFYNSVFHEEFILRRATISVKAAFSRAHFRNIADFKYTRFNQVTFVNTAFENITTFYKTVFHKNVQFKNTIFSKIANFNDAVFYGTLDLRDTIFDADANFLDITAKENASALIKVENRETARLIKNSFERRNNIIEANKFYALEMQKHEKELSVFKNTGEWLIFKLHGLSSNHSQSWLLPLLWMIIIAFINASTKLFAYTTADYKVFMGLILIFLVLSIGMISKTLYRKIFLSILSVIIYFFIPIELDTVVSGIQTFAIFKENVSFLSLIFSSIYAYLIYQFIIALRQNTRRK